jgi:hypothetical protein
MDSPFQVFQAPQACQVLGGSTQRRDGHTVQSVLVGTCEQALEVQGFTLILKVLPAFNAIEDEHHGGHLNLLTL